MRNFPRQPVLSGEGVTDLTGLSYAQYVLALDLSENKITKLKPLIGLKRLQFLNPDKTRAISPHPVTQHPAQLGYLSFRNNCVRVHPMCREATSISVRSGFPAPLRPLLCTKSTTAASLPDLHPPFPAVLMPHHSKTQVSRKAACVLCCLCVSGSLSA
ncbi:hypothetical protein CXQ68_11810 [Ethanoligenens harbinense YUAN-3]|nr:hypothetical protein CXQ68_11810 [Ethanoligenens harbinense YUAN-3]